MCLKLLNEKSVTPNQYTYSQISVGNFTLHNLCIRHSLLCSFRESVSLHSFRLGVRKDVLI